VAAARVAAMVVAAMVAVVMVVVAMAAAAMAVGWAAAVPEVSRAAAGNHDRHNPYNRCRIRKIGSSRPVRRRRRGRRC